MSNSNINERLERALKHLEPKKPVQGDEDEDWLDLSLIVLHAVHKGSTTAAALAEYCRGTDGDPRRAPSDLCSVIQELVEDGLLEMKTTEETAQYSLSLMGRTVLDLE